MATNFESVIVLIGISIEYAINGTISAENETYLQEHYGINDFKGLLEKFLSNRIAKVTV